MSVARRGAGLLAGAIACAGLTVPIGPPAYAEEGACSEIQDDTEDVDEVKAPSVPLEELGIEEATELLKREGKGPGEGVGVAVVDSGIADVAPVNEEGELHTGSGVLQLGPHRLLPRHRGRRADRRATAS